MSAQHHDVAPIAGLTPGRLHPVEANGTPMLLWRDEAGVSAVGATCPHAGALLAEGVVHDGRVVCPWHKSVFCLRTGALLDPPALDPLPRYPVRVAGGRVWVRLPAEPAPEPPATPDQRCFVIVGAGAAGAMAAQTLRAEGFGGRVVMLDTANRVPYDRTLLSKYALSGEPGGEKSPLQSQHFYQARRIERRTATVASLDAVQRRITCVDGSVLDYDAALLATGGEPKRPALPGADLANVFVLRSRADADAILACAERSQRAVVLGASFIGMEVAASLRERGLDVTVVAQESAPFEKQLGARIGSVFVGLHQRRGVTFRLGCKAERLEGETAVHGVRLAGGEVLPADLVVAGFGVKPATGFLHGVELADDGGVPVDAALRAADSLYATGDIARFPLRGDGPPIRVEHWRVAEQQGRLAALAMLGRDVTYDAVPVFWTIQYKKRLDYVGHAEDWDDVVVHGDLGQPRFLAYYVKDGIVRAAAGFDRDQDTASLLALLTLRRGWTAAELGDSPVAVLAGMG
jgi:NADPH-dependent 2,4-dienoyl-CoA reductase/sulfur reductase-like enzyme/nitrite reductase/ring-hydroxylating ferredoxin subunit